MNDPYIFTSKRLGFRTWKEEDLAAIHRINNDPNVMEYFPSIMTKKQTRDFIERMKKMHTDKNYCYFAVDLLDQAEFAGFIGLADQNYESPYTPCVDIGWRLSQKYWGKGLATEGARRCLQYGFKNLGLSEIRSIAPAINRRSVEVMKKIGMEKLGVFNHPKLNNHPSLAPCVCFQIATDNFTGEIRS